MSAPDEDAHRRACKDFADSYRDPACPLCQGLTGMQAWLPTRAAHQEWVQSEEFRAMRRALDAAAPIVREISSSVCRDDWGRK